jgi:hypothetical protein
MAEIFRGGRVSSGGGGLALLPPQVLSVGFDGWFCVMAGGYSNGRCRPEVAVHEATAFDPKLPFVEGSSGAEADDQSSAEEGG